MVGVDVVMGAVAAVVVAASGDGSPDLVNTLIATGPAGVLVALIVTGYLITRGHAGDLRAVGDQWRQAYVAEHEARLAAESTAEKLLPLAQLTADLVTKMNARMEVEREGRRRP